MKEENNLLLAFVLSMLILIGYDYMFLSNEPEGGEQSREITAAPAPAPAEVPARDSPPTAAMPVEPVKESAIPPPEKATPDSSAERVGFMNSMVQGSINLRGARLDDLTLMDYRQGLSELSPPVRLLAPGKYFLRHGWVSGDSSAKLPQAETLWRVRSAEADEITLEWDNGEGLLFLQKFSLDENYMFNVSGRVQNNSSKSLDLSFYGLVMRQPKPPTIGFFILHEGAVGYLGEELVEIDYDDIEKNLYRVKDGWLGITDKYWLVALAPRLEGSGGDFTARILKSGEQRYQVDYLGPPIEVAAGDSGQFNSLAFVGAKELELLDAYQIEQNIPRFELAVDFGWFYFLTKPTFYLLNFFAGIFANFGLAILALTVLVRILLYPLANKSFITMHKMKRLQPRMAELQKLHKEDKTKMRMEMMQLYKTHKLNPAAGCLPILLQIPVFFSLYKVLFVSIEMRHAPFYGWLRDLSAPDPTSIFNLFGLLPFTPPSFLQLGVLPILMGLSIYLQQKLSPPPPDPMQAKIMSFLPWLFMILLAGFPSGLLLYWTWNNVLSILQQYLLNKRLQNQE